MAKSVETITRTMKLKAESRPGGLTLRMGVKKHVLPFEVRTISSNEYVFVHVPPAASIFKMTKDGLVEVTSDAEAAAAQASFRKPRRKRGGGRAARKAVEMPAELEAALKMIPSGYRLAADKSGKPRLVKMRKRA